MSDSETEENDSHGANELNNVENQACRTNETNENKTVIINSDELTDDFLGKIFLRLDGKTLLNCMKSSRRFYKLLSHNWFWIEYARTHNILRVLPSLAWRNAAIKKHFNGNLNETVDLWSFDFSLKRLVLSRRGYSPFLLQFDYPFKYPSEEGIYFKGRTRTRDYYIIASGNGIQMETRGGIGCQPHPDVTKCYALSFGTSEIENFIDLVASGIDPWVLDYVRPTIRVSQKVNHRHDCSAKLRMTAHLYCCNNQYGSPSSGRGIHHHHRKRHQSIYKEWDQWTENNWEDWVIEFENYPSGMRHLTICNNGGDKQFWSGYYGPKIANIQIQIIMPEEPIVRALEIDT